MNINASTERITKEGSIPLQSTSTGNGVAYILAAIFSWLTLVACTSTKKAANTTTMYNKGQYGYDVSFLKNNNRNIIELQNEEGAKVLLSPEDQGRVMTSTATGDAGAGFGWLNYNLIASGERKKQFNAVGGEERFWLGPEGGQYALYFKKGDAFTIDNWQVPAVIDTVSFDIVDATKKEATFSKSASLVNYSGAVFDVGILRKIQLLDRNTLGQKLQIILPANLPYVAYQTINTITNKGSNDWKSDSGLLSIWLLGMMTPTDETKVIIPFLPLPDAQTYITDNYFGKIAPDRLLVKDSVLYLRCDGKSRGKIGISPVIAKPIAGSFDFKRNILTIIIPEIHRNAPYVNSKWELQEQPYKGDVINAYNDGPLQDGSQLGPFYEIESSSPAKELKAGDSMTYQQVTCHFQGDYTALKSLAKQLLNVDLDEVKKW